MPRKPVILTVVFILVTSGFMVFSLSYLQKLDWNFMGQKTLFLFGIIILFFQFNRLLRDLSMNTGQATKKINGLSYFVFLILPTVLACTLRLLPEAKGANVAENFARDLLAPESIDNDAFYFLLQRNANLPLSTPLTLSDLQNPAPPILTSEKLPNIFVIVIDSLRRDYLGVYNGAVSFTPNMDQFAAESLVFQNAFTHFGATGLSEPAIWAGGMIPHQSYPASFYVLNSLEKLVTTFPYRNFISQDSILKLILSPKFSFTEIDPKTSTQDLDLCQTLNHLKTQMNALTDDHPVFAYTQSQNLHVSVLAQKKTSAPEKYPGFYASYAESLSAIDKCFGDFISSLKKNNKYSDSVVVLTSDHGDSLGEEGRFGHAYTLFPEIIRIPLLFHLPQNSRYRNKVATTGVVFQTDITPTLYQLLGLVPEQDELDIRGKSLLLTPRPADESFLLASSYGPVFALLSDNGQSLRIFDAINLKDYAFDLSQDVAKPLSKWNTSEKAESMKIVKKKIGDWHGFYGFKNETK